MEIPVLVRSLKSSILSSARFQMCKTLWGVGSASVEQSRREANLVAQGDGKFGPGGWPQNPSKQQQPLQIIKDQMNFATGVRITNLVRQVLGSIKMTEALNPRYLVLKVSNLPQCNWKRFSLDLTYRKPVLKRWYFLAKVDQDNTIAFFKRSFVRTCVRNLENHASGESQTFDGICIASFFISFTCIS